MADKKKKTAQNFSEIPLNKLDNLGEDYITVSWSLSCLNFCTRWGVFLSGL